MGINTLSRKRSYTAFLFLLLCIGTNTAFAQCPTVSNPAQSFCDTQSPTIANLVATANGNGVVWYATATSTTPLSGSTTLINGEDYFADDNSGTCGSRQSTVVTIYGAPTGQNFQGVCVDNAANATIANLIATGNNVQWYTVSINGTPIPTTTVLVDNTIYYAGQTNPNTGCKTSRLSVFVNVGYVPVPTGPATQQFCNDPATATVANLVASGNNDWYLTASDVTPLDNATPLIDGQHYFATTIDPPCESVTRFETIVSIAPPNNAGTNGTKMICQTQVSTTAPFNLFGLLGGTPDTTGTWTGPLSTTNGFQGTVDVSTLTLAGSPYTFTYNVSTSICPNAVSTVRITIVPPANAGTNGAITVCSSAPSQNLFSSLGGTPQAGGTWSPAMASGTGVFNPAVDPAGTYTYTVTGTAPCPNATATVTVTNIPRANAGTNGTLSICTNAASQNLFTLLGGTPQAGGTWTPAMASGTGVFNPAVDPAGVYTYTVTGTAPCQNAAATVTVTKVLPPNAGTDGTLTICSNAASQNLFSSLGGTPQSGGTWSPAMASGTGVFNPTVDPAGVYTYTVTGTAPCTNATATVTVTKQPAPNAGTNGTLTICGNGASQNLFTLLGGTPQTGGTWSPAMASGTGVYNPAVDPAGVYTYTVTGTAPCPNATATVTVTKVLPPNAGTNGTLTICSNAAPQNLFSSLGGTPQSGGTWTPAMASGTGVFNPTVDPAGVYTYTVTGTAPCANATATVTVTKQPAPNAGTNGTLTICGNGASQNLFTLLGGTPQTGGTWSPAMASGTGVFNPAVDPAGVYTYTVTGTVPCPNATATVTVTKVLPPNAGTNGTLTICSNAAPQNLFSSLGGTPQSGGTWSPAMASGTGVFNPIVDPAGVYTYTVTGTAPCTNATATVTVTKQPAPNAGTNGTLTICGNGASQNLFILLGGTPQSGGTWTPAMASGTGVFNPAVDPAGVYTYTVTGTAPCPNATATVTVTKVLPPNAGTNGALTICSNAAPQNLFSSLGGTPQSGGTWSPAMASGTGVFNPAVDPAGIYTYTVTGTVPCANATATVTVTKQPAPNAGTNGALTICGNGASQNLFTLLGGTPQAGGTWTPAMASGTGVFNPAVDPAGVYTYTVNGTAPCPNATATVTVTKVLPPNAGTNGALTICSNAAPQNLFSSLGGTPQSGGTWSPAMASGTGVFNPTLDPAGVYTYTVTGTAPCANATATVTVTKQLAPNAGTNGSLTICGNGVSQNLFTLLGGTPQAGGTWTPAMASGTGVYNPAVDPAGVYTYTVNGTAPCPNATATVTVTKVLPPNAGTDGTLTICSNANPQDLFSSLGGTPQLGGTWTPSLASGTGVFNPAIDAQGIYTYTVTGTAPCANASATVSVTVVPAPIAGTNANLTLCSTSAAQDLFPLLGNTAQTGGTWSPAMASGTGVFNPALDAPNTYTYTVTGTAPCANATASVVVNVNQAADAGIDGSANLCSTASPQDLFTFLTGTPQLGGTWSPTLASGTGIFNPAVDPAGNYTYTIIGTAPCANDTSVVAITITTAPNPGTSGNAVFCINSAPQDLFLSLGGTPQAGGTWSPAMASGTGVFNPAIDAATIYTYTLSGTPPCSNASATVNVTVNPIPDAGLDGTAFFCSNYPPADLFANLGGTPQTGGTWSPAMVSGTGVFNPLLDAAGTYTYTVGGGLCAVDTATVTVTVTQSPNAGGLGASLLINTCTTTTTVDLFTGLNGSQGVGTWSDNDSTGALAANIFNPSIVGAGTYHFSYTVNGGSSPCPTDVATVTVIVSPLPNAGTATGAQSICNSTTSFDLSTLITGNQLGGTWSNAAGTVSNPINPTGLTPNTYSYTYTISNACGNDTETVQLTILPNPALFNSNISVISPICIGSFQVVSLFGMADGNYTLNYDLSGSNNLAGQVASVTVAGGTANFTISPTSIPIIGTTTITFTNIANATCSTAVNATATFNITPLANLDDSNLTIANICAGSPANVIITNATGLPDGNYQFMYFTVPQSTPNTGTTTVVAITAGAGQFSVPATSFTSTGNYSLTINSIINLSGGCGNPNENATATFQIVALPNTAGGSLNAASTCANSSNVVSITGATNLSDGNYTINYQLSGASTTSSTATVSFVAGSASFTIPATDLTTAGNVTVTVTQLISGTSLCGTSGTTFAPVTFTVTQLATPTITAQGNEFCDTDHPTIAELSANVSGTGTIIWYNAPTAGTAYSNSDLLVDLTTYYAADTSVSGCESPIRLAVTVDLSKCPDLMIPDGFSPNGDNINDQFVIENLIETYPNFKLEIYNRYGNTIYKGNKNTPNWDGTTTASGIKTNNATLPPGVYFYVLEYNDGAKSPKQGRIYLSR